MARRRRGRQWQTKLTSEIISQVRSLLRAGNYLETAAAVVGVARRSLYNWLRKGRDAEDGIYKEFHDVVMESLAWAEALDVATIREAAKKDWKAAAWRLERKNFARWGKTNYVEVVEKGAGTSEVEDARRELARRIARIAATQEEEETDRRDPAGSGGGAAE